MFEVWADGEDGHRPLMTELEKDNSVGNPLFCFAALDADERLQLLLVDSLDVENVGYPLDGIDYRIWTEVVLERLAPERLRITFGRVSQGKSGELAEWLTRKGLTLEQLAIL
ncbi:hypothetical protein [Sulfobacillus harzensis]|uniref:Uncharacterized protein n=1 Tax=Sulfobacillus harzensis TaxID=2729629 RepID=A0A7Y0L888_9FIRM|nr:hypothetical protein [Sulfobacillus harzensis]NMP24596.1 hypothetical protein [Sulfobacillus harzensis]